MDKKYINRTVMNKKHGKGIITNIVNNDITIKFEKIYIYYNFKFPDAFKDGTLTAIDPDLSSYIQCFPVGTTSANALERRMRYGKIPVVFFNIAWMKWYDGVTKNDIPVNGGDYVDRNHDGNEVWNFSPVQAESSEDDEVSKVSEWLFGSYETKSTHGKIRQTHIEKIAGCQDLKNEGFADGVLVIWCATDPNGGRRVVGWYEDATVCRYYESQRVEESDGSTIEYSYNVYTKAENAVLLSEGERSDAKWYVPGYTRNGGTTFGFGQSNVWYASEPAAKEYVKELINSIDGYDGPTFIEAFEKRKGGK